MIWQCNNIFKGECKCGTPHQTEEDIKAKFLEAYSQLLPDRDRLIEDCRLMQTEMTDSSDSDRETRELLQELEKEHTERMAKADAIGGFMFRLRELDQPLEHFDEWLWLDVIDSVTVHRDGDLTYKSQNGTEVRV